MSSQISLSHSPLYVPCPQPRRKISLSREAWKATLLKSCQKKLPQQERTQTEWQTSWLLTTWWITARRSILSSKVLGRATFTCRIPFQHGGLPVTEFTHKDSVFKCFSSWDKTKKLLSNFLVSILGIPREEVSFKYEVNSWSYSAKSPIHKRFARQRTRFTW